MKLLRYKKNNKIFPGLIDNEGNIRDLSQIIKDIDPNNLNTEIFKKIYSLDKNSLPNETEKISILPCINNVSKIICVGLNYYDHAKELNLEIPKEPIIFMKATSAISGPNDNIIIPKNSKKTDWEIELAIVINKKGSNIDQKDSLNYIAGYCILNDISERAYQLEQGGQWVKGKSCDTFCPIGPYLVTPDEISDPQNLKIWLKLNNRIMQNSSTSFMIYKVEYLISYISKYMTLNAGDIISTGTPPGVGGGMNPKVFLKNGDIINAGIDNLGEQNQKVINYNI
tara:strand:+ start:1779 stop:2627 length:849 start_codon:yes stop_codon:yes gene_type:complete